MIDERRLLLGFVTPGTSSLGDPLRFGGALLLPRYLRVPLVGRSSAGLEEWRSETHKLVHLPIAGERRTDDGRGLEGPQARGSAISESWWAESVPLQTPVTRPSGLIRTVRGTLEIEKDSMNFGGLVGMPTGNGKARDSR